MQRERGARGTRERSSRRRTVAELLNAAQQATNERHRLESEREAKEKVRQEREAAAARAKYLEKLAGREPALWKRVNELIATRRPKSYEEAVVVLADLRDLSGHKDASDFGRRLELLRAEHAKKEMLIRQLQSAGL